MSAPSSTLEVSTHTRFSLIALATAAFVYVTAETLPIGLLPELSRGLHVREGSIGLLVTVYAAAAGLGAIPVTAWTSHLSRRRIVVVSVGVLAVSQVAMALAPDYAFVMAARIVCALAHGVFWAVLPTVAASLVPAHHSGRATSIVFTGSAIAFVVGTPAATAVGDLLGWRSAEGLVGVLAGAIAILLVFVLPPLEHNDAEGTDRRINRVGALVLRPSLFAICGVTVLIVTSQYTVYTYIAPLIRRDGELTGLLVSLVLLLNGAAGIVSNLANGRLIDRRPRRVAFSGAIAVVASLGALALFGPGSAWWTVLTVVVWGAAFSAMPLSVQAAVLRAVPDAPVGASSIMCVAFQIGIGGGALLGAVLDRSGDLALLPIVGAALAAAAVLVIAAARNAFPARVSPPSEPAR